jgi:toxin ParE1/3/4
VRMVPEFYISFVREVFVGRYRLVYTYQDGVVKIVAVRPMGRPLGKL